MKAVSSLSAARTGNEGMKMASEFGIFSNKADDFHPSILIAIQSRWNSNTTFIHGLSLELQEFKKMHHVYNTSLSHGLGMHGLYDMIN
jgi:hypothetical protein